MTPQEFARYHPGGRLGRRLLRVGELMHTGDALPRIDAGTNLEDAIVTLDAGKLGMVCVTDADGRLAGILTDGDLRRRMLREPMPLTGDVDQAMIADPRTVGEDTLASEALHVLEENKITSLPVVDGDRKLLGVIQIHDLWRTELF